MDWQVTGKDEAMKTKRVKRTKAWTGFCAMRKHEPEPEFFNKNRKIAAMWTGEDRRYYRIARVKVTELRPRGGRGRK